MEESEDRGGSERRKSQRRHVQVTIPEQPRMPQLAAACIACKTLKIRCSRDHPCERCARMGLECVPQARGRGRPKINPSSPSRADKHAVGKSPPKKKQAVGGGDAGMDWGPMRAMSGGGAMPVNAYDPRGFYGDDVRYLRADATGFDGADLMLPQHDLFPPYEHMSFVNGQDGTGAMNVYGPGPSPSHVMLQASAASVLRPPPVADLRAPVAVPSDVSQWYQPALPPPPQQMHQAQPYAPQHDMSNTMAYHSHHGYHHYATQPQHTQLQVEMPAHPPSSPTMPSMPPALVGGSSISSISSNGSDPHLSYYAGTISALHGQNRLDLPRLQAFMKELALCVTRGQHSQARELLEHIGTHLGMEWQALISLEEGAELMALRDDLVLAENAMQAAMRDCRDLVTQWSHQEAAVSFCILCKGEFRVYTNERFRSSLQSEGTLDSSKMLPFLSWIRLLSPDDQFSFLSLVVRASFADGFTGPVDVSLTARCLYKDGTQRLGLVRYRAHGVLSHFSISEVAVQSYSPYGQAQPTLIPQSTHSSSPTPVTQSTYSVSVGIPQQSRASAAPPAPMSMTTYAPAPYGHGDGGGMAAAVVKHAPQMPQAKPLYIPLDAEESEYHYAEHYIQR